MKMRTPVRVGFTLGAVATLLGLVLICAPRRQPEPLHKGKKISFWINGIREPSRERDSFVNATLDIGPPAVPYLVKAIRAQNSTVRRSRWYANSWAWLPSIAKAQLPSPVRGAGTIPALAYTLVWLGPAAEDAVPLLITFADEPDPSTRY